MYFGTLSFGKASQGCSCISTSTCIFLHDSGHGHACMYAHMHGHCQNDQKFVQFNVASNSLTKSFRQCIEYTQGTC